MIENRIMERLQQVAPNSPEAHRLIAFKAAFDVVKDDGFKDFPIVKSQTTRTEINPTIVPYEPIITRLRVTPEQFAQRMFYREYGGKTPSELEKFLKGKSRIEDYATSMIRNKKEFITLPKPVRGAFIDLSLAELGVDDWITTAQLLGTKDDVDDQGRPASFTKGKGQEIGLNLCSAELAIYQRAADQEQKLGDAYWVAMKPIIDSLGRPNVFRLERNEGGRLWLFDSWAFPDDLWLPGNRLVWALPQVEPKAA